LQDYKSSEDYNNRALMLIKANNTALKLKTELEKRKVT
jgi:hypothetical protein